MATKIQMKLQVYKPKSINEAINLFQDFLECDLWTKFYPEIRLGKKGNEIWHREDMFKSEQDFRDYLQLHFNLLRNEIKYLQKKKR